MLSKGDLLHYGKHLVINLGLERTREMHDDEGYGGLFVPQVKVAFVSEGPTWGKHCWVERRHLKKVDREVCPGSSVG